MHWRIILLQWEFKTQLWLCCKWNWSVACCGRATLIQPSESVVWSDSTSFNNILQPQITLVHQHKNIQQTNETKHTLFSKYRYTSIQIYIFNCKMNKLRTANNWWLSESRPLPSKSRQQRATFQQNTAHSAQLTDRLRTKCMSKVRHEDS